MSVPAGSVPDARVYRFGPFEADVRSGELRKLGIAVRLREQPFQILILLLERPGEVVLREEIRLRLWPGDVVVDFDHSINTAIQRLRDALNETAARPRYVETVGRRGYRFIGEVQPVGDNGASDDAALNPPAAHTAPSGSKLSKLPRLWAAAVPTAVLLSAVGWWLWRPAAISHELTVPLTTLPGSALSPSFSPDGSKVAFSWGGYQQENQDIYVKQIGADAVLRLTSRPAWDELPVWSPDDRYIAFVRRLRNGVRAVILIPPLGGPERKVAEFVSHSGPIPMGNPVPLSWTPDGKWLAVALRSSREEPSAIWLIAIDSGERRRLTSPTGLDDDTNPSFSPDGTMLAFSRGNSLQYIHRPYVLTLSRDWKPIGEPRLLPAPTRTLISGIAWAGTREIVYGAGGGAAAHLWRADVSGRGSAVRLNVGEDALCPAISMGTHRLVYAARDYDSHIWSLETATGVRKPLIVARGVQAFPRYSPDGRKIAFMSTRSGEQEIWTCNADGTNCVPLTSFGGPQTGAPNWSPDGRGLAFDTRPEDKGQIFTVSSDGGAPRRISVGDADDITPSWSHDGRWIYFASNRTGRFEIWKMPAQGGPAIQVTSEGGLWPEETADGRFLYYNKLDNSGLFRRLLDGGEETQVRSSLATASAWALSSSGLYFVPGRDDPVGMNRPGSVPILRFQSFGGGEARTVAELDRGGIGLCVSPDGSFVIGSRMKARADLMLVEHFR